MGHERDTVDDPSPPAKRWLKVKNERPLTRVGGVRAAYTEVIHAVSFNAEVGQTSAPNGLPKLQSVSTTSECTASLRARRGSALRLSLAKSIFVRR